MTLITFNSVGNITLSLPLGNVKNDYKIDLSVRIFNDLGGYILFTLLEPVQVFANIETTSNMVSQVISDQTSSTLSSTNILQSASSIIGITSVLNSINYTNNSQVNSFHYIDINLNDVYK
jgi:hypothetical protein